jgi:endoglucanase
LIGRADDLVAQAWSRPPIRVNQLGYLPDGPKTATWITDSDEPHVFGLESGGGRPSLSGRSRLVSGIDGSSGFSVQLIDFSDLRDPGTYRVVVDDDPAAASVPFDVSPDPYRGVFEDALKFFYAQRSGCEIREVILPGYRRPAGHVGIAPNQGDTAVSALRGPAAEHLYPGWVCPGRFDVSGGWYDAGDHGKYVVGGGISAALLLAAHERLIRRHGCVEPHLTTEPAVLDEALWEVDWMLRMQVPAGYPHAGMAFHRVHDSYWTEFPLAPQADPAPRVLHRPSTAATLNLAAVAAHAARLVADSEPAYAATLIAAAEHAYRAAVEQPDLFAPDDQGANGGGPYHDDRVGDEFYWAAAELFLTTGERRYLDAVSSSACHHEDVFDVDGFDWDSVAAFARIELATVRSDLPDRSRIRASVIEAAERLVDLQARQPWSQPYAPTNGWDWGSNGRILNNLIVIATAYDISGDARYLESALSGIDYVFGRNPVGISFVTGYGADYSHRQRVRHFAKALDPAYPPPPRGALAGGPASKTYPGFPGDPRFEGLPPQLRYVDDPTSETTNDVCIRWNASLVWLTLFLATASTDKRPASAE